jgi:hypothetical protein
MPWARVVCGCEGLRKLSDHTRMCGDAISEQGPCQRIQFGSSRRWCLISSALKICMREFTVIKLAKWHVTLWRSLDSYIRSICRILGARCVDSYLYQKCETSIVTSPMKLVKGTEFVSRTLVSSFWILLWTWMYICVFLSCVHAVQPDAFPWPGTCLRVLKIVRRSHCSD